MYYYCFANDIFCSVAEQEPPFFGQSRSRSRSKGATPAPAPGPALGKIVLIKLTFFIHFYLLLEPVPPIPGEVYLASYKSLV